MCYNQVKQTRVKKSTNSPVWSETFFFNFNASPAELFDECLEFTVYNSRKLRSDAMIGSFKVIKSIPTHRRILTLLVTFEKHFDKRRYVLTDNPVYD